MSRPVLTDESPCRFLKSLAHTASHLKEDWAEFEFLHINLGPHWRQREAEQLFATVVEVDNTGWERPPGLGICALEKTFYLCHVIHNWLRSSEHGEHGVVSIRLTSLLHMPLTLTLLCNIQVHLCARLPRLLYTSSGYPKDASYH